MKLLFKNLPENMVSLSRRIGYIPRGDRGEEFEMIRPLERSGYPRFHIFAKKDQDNNFSLSLHLDQKKPSYQGSAAHSGEYESEVVLKEEERIRAILKN